MSHIVTVNHLVSLPTLSEAVRFAEATETLLGETGSVRVKETSTGLPVPFRVKAADTNTFTVGQQETQTTASSIHTQYHKSIETPTPHFYAATKIVNRVWEVDYETMVNQIRENSTAETFPHNIETFQNIVSETLTKAALRGISFKK